MIMMNLEPTSRSVPSLSYYVPSLTCLMAHGTVGSLTMGHVLLAAQQDRTRRCSSFCPSPPAAPDKPFLLACLLAGRLGIGKRAPHPLSSSAMHGSCPVFDSLLLSFASAVSLSLSRSLPFLCNVCLPKLQNESPTMRTADHQNAKQIGRVYTHVAPAWT